MSFNSRAENKRFSTVLLQLVQLQNSNQLKEVKEKQALLLQLCSLNPDKSQALFLYYKLLLFNAAYPANRFIYKLCIRELLQFHEKVSRLSKKERAALDQSGLPGSHLHGVYSFTLLNWLSRENLLDVRFQSFDEDAVHPRLVFRDNLKEAEFELLSLESKRHQDWIKLAFGCNDGHFLPELLKQVGLLRETGSEKDLIFESLRPIVQFTCGAVGFKLSFEKLIHLHPEALLKKVDPTSVIGKALPEIHKLRSNQKQELIRSARMCLLYLNRETDPVTNCSEEGIEYYRLERGFSLALFSQDAERRLPFESYIGFMMYKNGLPVAYGGAWLFGRKSLLGINIFEAYRGGESAFLFAQLLRAYRQRFGISSIEVEAYQFGLDNPEGINTGAFWFYYRFGFRPSDARLRKIAANEFKKINASRSYKCPRKTLKAFTASNMVLDFETPEELPTTSALSFYISECINRYFSANRKDFSLKATEKIHDELGIQYTSLSKKEKLGFDKLLPFVSLCLDYKDMTDSDKIRLRELILEKGKSEFRFTEYCAAFPFSKYLKKIN